MRLAWLVLASACGRIGFEPAPLDDAGVPSAPSLRVAPDWVPAEGGDIVVTLDRDAAGASVLVDGTPCEAPVITGAQIACRAPAHVPAYAPVTLADDPQTSATLRYLVPGPIRIPGMAIDGSSGIALDAAGNTYLSGGTLGALGGPNAGEYDMVLVKLDSLGNVAWIRQLGSSVYDYARDVAVDGNGDITIVGYTSGVLGAASAGGTDVVVARYRADGELAWVTQLGSANDDESWDLAVDRQGDTVVATRTTGSLPGFTSAGGMDYAVARLAPDGSVRWIRQAGSAANDNGHSVAISDAGPAYLVGFTTGSVQGGVANAGLSDLFVARYEADGTQAWIRQRGGALDDFAYDVTIDDTDEVWIAAVTLGPLDATPASTEQDLAVLRVGPDGEHRFTRRFAGDGAQLTFGITVVPDGGDVYVNGTTTAGFAGEAAFGSNDSYVVSLTRAGDPRWARIRGTIAGNELGSSIAIAPTFDGLIYQSLIVDDDFAMGRYDTTGTNR